MNVIVFSPHPDDAEIVMGGTIAKYTRKGHDVLIVLVTIPSEQEIRKNEVRRAAEILSARLSILDLDPYRLVFDRKLVELFDKVLKDFPPDIIYTSWLHDSHQDHLAVSKAAISAARKNNSSLYMYEQEIPSGITPAAFRAQAFVDISDVIDIKMQAIMAHKSQFSKYGQEWIDGIRGRASYWGNRLNTKYAEAFEVVREIKVI
ncbi:PIG-L deacetylase family protein [Chloroflexota bacterium]